MKAQRQCREDRAAPDYGLPKAAREAMLTTFVSILCLPVVGVIDFSVLNIALAFIRLMKWTFQDYQQGAPWWPVGNLDNSVSMLKLRLKNCLQGHGETSWSVHVRPNVRAKPAPTVGRQAQATENVHRTRGLGLVARRWGSA